LPASHQRVEDNQALQLAFEGHPVRAIKDAEGKPWFVGADVCAILGYADSVKAIKAHCKSPELLRQGDSPYLEINPRGMTIINRVDVYRLIMRTQLPAAMRFEMVVSSPARTGRRGSWL
jgi:prophage antirepressor-like protein